MLCLAAHAGTMLGLDHAIRQLAYRGSDTPGAIATTIWIVSSLTWSILAFLPPSPRNKLLTVALITLSAVVFLVVGFALTIRF
jgi:hypothetical protein